MENEHIPYIEKLLDADSSARPTTHLTLPFELRQKSRQRVTLDNGEEVGLFLARGTVLRNGDLLEAENGLVVEVKAAPETLSVAHTADRHMMLRACYHLGNRHVPVQIGEDSVSYLHDHVLDDMLRGLGLEISSETAPFEPESGAYHSHGDVQTHNHSHP